ncbi:MAG: ribosome small subunit-dependent GTPase A [Clostridia bacterium]|jgi:ribosome biogenesis GTPase
MIEGIIIKGVGGFYYIRSEDGLVWECKARGKFRKQRLTPLVGDRVVFQPGEGEELGFIDEILSRRNEMIRPPVANIDQVIVVLSYIMPQPDYLLIDKMLLQASKQSVQALLCINKCDLINEDQIRSMYRNFKNTGYPILQTSAKSGLGIAELKKFMKGKLSTFAGQSGVGKSSLLNRISPHAQLKTSELSEKIERGRHTTRHAEIIFLEDNGMVIDTPGFSLMEMDDTEPTDIAAFYPDFQPYLGNCKFSGCLHMEEPACSIKEAVDKGRISTGRYERYRLLVEESIEKWSRKYD